MDVAEYKKYHEDHMANNTGTTAEECGILISLIPFCVFLSSCLVPYIPRRLIPIFEFLTVILPLILSCTIFADVNHIILLNFTLISTTIIILQVDVNNVKKLLNEEVKEINGKKPSISNFRASTNFVSAICILAVDFVVFPKGFIKTETFGFSVMDTGVGFFICSNGLVEKNWAKQTKFSKLLKTQIILCGLGFIRLLSVKSVDYHEHVSEYGTHWNFFFTLALCRFLVFIIIKLIKNPNPLYISITIGLLYQLLLFLFLEEWVLIDHKRDSFLTANREGLVSCLGYSSLYFAAYAVGNIFHTKGNTYKNLIIKLLSISVLSWFGLICMLNITNVSRKLVNLSYIFWMVALSMTELLLLVILEIGILSIKVGKTHGSISPVPKILESINEFGLIFFLLSNLLTGLVNMVFQTLLMGEVISLLIIISYMVVLCSIIYFLHVKKIVFNIENIIGILKNF